MPNYLGVDYGTKRIGLAWADELGIALPIGAFPGVGQPDWKNKIGEVIVEKKIDEIIVGTPSIWTERLGYVRKRWIGLLKN